MNRRNLICATVACFASILLAPLRAFARQPKVTMLEVWGPSDNSHATVLWRTEDMEEDELLFWTDDMRRVCHMRDHGAWRTVSEGDLPKYVKDAMRTGAAETEVHPWGYKVTAYKLA